MDMNHILIVEDDKDIREGVAIYLKSQGYKVFMAGDGMGRAEGSGKRRNSSRHCGHYDAPHGRHYHDYETA